MMFQADLTRMLQRPKHIICPVHTHCSWHCWGHCKSKILYLFFSFLYTLSYVFFIGEYHWHEVINNRLSGCAVNSYLKFTMFIF